MFFGSALNMEDIYKLQAYYDAGNITENSEIPAKALAQVNTTYNAIKAVGEITEENWREKRELLEAATAAYNELKEKYGDRRLENIADYQKALEDFDKYKVDLVLGDANLDGTVDTTDALWILQHAVKLRELTGDALKVSKVSEGDDPVSVVDALLVLQKAVKVRDKFPIEEQKL